MKECDPSHQSKRILIWTASFPPVLGGLQTVTHQLATGLYERKHEVLVLTNRPSRSLPAKEYSTDSYTLRRYRHWQSGLNPQSPKSLLSSLGGTVLFPFQQRRIANMIGNFKPDVVNVHFPNVQNCYTERLWPLLRYARLVVSLHGHDILQWYETGGDNYTYSRLRPLNRLEVNQFRRQQLLLERSNCVTACSAWLAEKTIQLFPFAESKIKVIYNGVDLKRFAKETDTDTELEPCIFAFGRLDTHKGFDLLIQAFASIVQGYPDMFLAIAGEGPARHALEQLAIELGIAQRMRWLGKLGPEAVAAHCRQASLIAVPSRRETFGISVLEALASGRPVVASNVGGIPEIAQYFGLRLCEPTLGSLEKALLQIINERFVTNYHYSPEMLERFSLKNMINNYFRVLEGHFEHY